MTPRVWVVLGSVCCCLVAGRPIVGVLSVPTAKECVTALGGRSVAEATGGGSCFHSLYVKWLEAAGAQVVPIRYDSSDAQLKALVAQLNGVLFTGGEVDIKARADPAAAQYMRAASLLYDEVRAAHAEGEAVPLWGTCMGLQTLSILGAGGNGTVLSSGTYDSENESLSLELTPAAKASRLLGGPDAHGAPDVMRWLTTENVTSNLHHDGVGPAEFEVNAQLRAAFTPLSTNEDRNGLPFVSTIEAKGGAPIWATQWHPERPQFEWVAGRGINHGAHAVKSMQFFANFFVARARENNRSFASEEAEAKALIYNFRLTGTTSYQAYLFDPASAL